MGKNYTDIIWEMIDKREIGGIVVLTGNLERNFHYGAYGLAEINPDRPMLKTSIFDAASVTKPVATATACGICIQDGLIDLNAPLIRYLPEIRSKGQDVTILSLATHVSGFDDSHRYMKNKLARESLIQSILDTEPVRKMGEKFEYSCLNYILLGFAIERAAGKSLASFCRERIFAPLKTNDTRFGPLKEEKKRLVRFLRVDPGEISDEVANFARKPVGNAGLFTTAEDLAKFCRMILNKGKVGRKRIISKETIDIFYNNLNPKGVEPRSFGWDIRPEFRPRGFSEKCNFHTGWTGQSVFIDPGKNIFVIILTNRIGDHDKAIRSRMNVAEALLQEILPRKNSRIISP